MLLAVLLQSYSSGSYELIWPACYSPCWPAATASLAHLGHQPTHESPRTKARNRQQLPHVISSGVVAPPGPTNGAQGGSRSFARACGFLSSHRASREGPPAPRVATSRCGLRYRWHCALVGARARPSYRLSIFFSFPADYAPPLSRLALPFYASFGSLWGRVGSSMCSLRAMTRSAGHGLYSQVCITECQGILRVNCTYSPRRIRLLRCNQGTGLRRVRVRVAWQLAVRARPRPGPHAHVAGRQMLTPGQALV